MPSRWRRQILSPEVITSVEGRCARIRLDRPKALHALTLEMCGRMTEALLAWANDPDIAIVMIDHAEGRGFCAGGDIVTLTRRGAAGVGDAFAFFETEFRLDHLLFTYPKPTIAFMDGLTMGGGVGLSQPCAYRVATERTLFAMPETGIGYFPDVGGGWYLSRLPGRLGQFVALTGARLSGPECLTVGLATHGVASDALAATKAAIIADPGSVDAILARASDLTPAVPSEQAKIDALFAADDVEEIERRLAADGSDWARDKLKELRSKAPTSCKVALRLLRESAAMTDFADELRLEHALATRMILRPDFAEGVRALLIDRTDDPKWQPTSPQEVDDVLLDSLFAPLPTAAAWTPLSRTPNHDL